MTSFFKRQQLAKEAAQEFMEDFHPDRKWWIVGGMLRDTILSTPFKDIDIFINGRAEDLLPEGDVDKGDKNAFLLRAYTVKSYPYKGEDFEINLIFMRGDFWDLEQMTDRCDFGICQIGWEPSTDKTYRSDAFELDLRKRTITLTRETTKGRVNRMKDKMPLFEFRNPRQLTVDGQKRWCYNPETSELEIRFDKLVPKVDKSAIDFEFVDVGEKTSKSYVY